jgi:hypothetical protein
MACNRDIFTFLFIHTLIFLQHIIIQPGLLNVVLQHPVACHLFSLLISPSHMQYIILKFTLNFKLYVGRQNKK